MVGKKRLSLALIYGAASLLVVVLWPASPSLALKEQHPGDHRIWHRPTFGGVATYRLASGAAYEHQVDMFWEWEHEFNLNRIDAPRTPQYHGAYEHELRFLPGDNGEARWCVGDPSNVVRDLPAGSYRDTADIDTGEFTWGMQGWRVVKDYLYSVRFDCNSGAGVDNDRFSLISQVGHCHNLEGSNCPGPSVFGDTSTTQIPRRVGQVLQGAKGFHDNFIYDSLAGPSFEDGTAPWAAETGSITRACDWSVAYAGNCFIRINPGSGSPASISYRHNPQPSGVSTASTYIDTVLRCPNYWNSNSCTFKLAIVCVPAIGAATVHERVDTIPNDDRWYARTTHSSSCPSDTDHWRFRIGAGSGDRLQIDYNQEWYFQPL